MKKSLFLTVRNFVSIVAAFFFVFNLNAQDEIGAYDNLAALKAASTEEDFPVLGTLASELVITHTYGDGYFYIQDESMGLLLDGNFFAYIPSTSGTLEYATGDRFSNATVMYVFSGGEEFWMAMDLGARRNDVTVPEIVTLAQLNADKVRYANRLVKVDNVKFNQTGEFAAGTSYSVSDGNLSSNVSFFPGSDVFTTAIPDTEVKLTGIYRATTGAISPRSLSDIEVLSSAVPVITLNTDKIEIDRYLLDGGEPQTVSFLVKASDLQSDIVLTVNSEHVEIAKKTIAKDDEALSGDGVEVECIITPVYTGNMGSAEVSVATDGVDPVKVSISWFVYPVAENLADMYTVAFEEGYFIGAIKGEIAVTAKNNKYLFLQDGTKAITLPVEDASVYTIGDYYAGMCFNVVTEGDKVDHIEIFEQGELLRNGVVVAETVTLASLSENIDLYQNRLVKLENILFGSTGQFTEETVSRYDFTQNGTAAQISLFAGSDIMGTGIPAESVDVVGVFRNNAQGMLITPRSLADIVYKAVIVPDPVVTLNTDKIEIEHYLLDGGKPETISFFVKASDLKGDIELTVNSKDVALSLSTIASDNADLAADGVEVKAVITPVYSGTPGNAEITLTSEGVEPVKLNIVWSVYAVADNLAAMYNMAAAEGHFNGSISGEIAVTAKNDKYIFLQDATKAITLTVTDASVYTIGDYYAGMCFSVVMEGDVVDNVEIFEQGELVRNGEVEAETVTLAAVSENIGFYQNRLVKLEEIEFVSDGKFTSESASRYDFTQNGTAAKMSLFAGSDIMGTDIPAKKVNVVGIFRNNADGMLITPRSLADIVEVDPNGIGVIDLNMTVWSEKGMLCIDVNEGSKADIYTVIGQRVMTVNLNSGLNNVELGQGAYIIKIGGSATKVYVK